MLEISRSSERSWYWTEIFGSGVPTLVLIDLQQEYRSDSRALSIPSASPAISACALALAHARKLGMPVAFTRLALPSAFFNTATKFHRWIDGFVPHGSDLVFDRSLPSCYSSQSFADVVGRAGGNIVIAGFAGDGACLATAVDAFHRGHRTLFLKDASASHRVGELDNERAHEVVTSIIGQYSTTIETQDWIQRTKSLSLR